jgi:hypothetical protein
MSPGEPADQATVGRATAFVFHLRDQYRSYHDHKESMAYAGAALYVAAFGTALVSKDWPPFWGPASKQLAVVTVTVAWLAMLFYQKWQLRRRRWAALRVAATERLLASWISRSPTEEDLTPWAPQLPEKSCPSTTILDYLWPLREAVSAVDRTEAVYPSALVRSLIMQEARRSTEALNHERLVIIVGWALYIALIVRTILSSVADALAV